MKLKSLALVAFGLLASNAMACYTVYDPSNRVAYQGSAPPVDMSLPLREAMERRFPGGHLVFEQTADCPTLGLGQLSRPAGVNAPPNTLVMGSGPGRKVAVAKTMETPVEIPVAMGEPSGVPNTAVMGAGPSSGVVMQRRTVIAATHTRSMVGSSPLLTDRSTAAAMGVPYTELSGSVVVVPPLAAAR